jgi:hypothetical protein
MKKTILRAMLFFAFFAIGLQSASAQYVTSDDATILLTAEIQEALDLTANLNEANKATQGRYLDQKVKLFTFVKGQIANGATVEVSVQQGADRFNHTVNSFSGGITSGKDPYVTPLHQEILDLLTQ